MWNVAVDKEKGNINKDIKRTGNKFEINGNVKNNRNKRNRYIYL